MLITLLDYGAGNLHSIGKALALSGAEVRIEPDATRCTDTDVLVLPGVGGFAHATERLAPARTPLRDAICGGLPTLGICLGMQLLFDRSEEGEGKSEGLGIIDGDVTRLRAERVPHIGWNRVEEACDPLLRDSALESAYYANSFACRPADVRCVTAWTTHGSDRFPAMLRVESCIGVQFHPEKSSAAGVRFLLGAVAELAGVAR